MANLCNYIEEYLKTLLREREGTLELQRSELAGRFDCAPSQINYVLATRFTPERGYVVESRRGGGGFIRIIRLQLEPHHLRDLIQDRIGDQISQDEAFGLVDRLVDEGLVTPREGSLMQAAVQRESLPLGLPQRDVVRASLLKAMLLAILRS